MITIPQALIETVFLPGLLAATRVVGLFLSAPFFALQTIPGRFRVGLALVVAFGIPLQIGALTTISINTSTAGFMALAGIELLDRKSTRLNSSHIQKYRMPSSA